MENEMQAEVSRRVEAMTDEEQAHFKLLIHQLVMCYGEDAGHAVVIIGGSVNTLASVVTVNCNEMEASRLLLAADDAFGYINTRGAPPKENFN